MPSASIRLFGVYTAVLDADIAIAVAEQDENVHEQTEIKKLAIKPKLSLHLYGNRTPLQNSYLSDAAVVTTALRLAMASSMTAPS